MCNGGRCKVVAELLWTIRELSERGINLDGFTTDPDKLMDIWAAVRFSPVRAARILFPDRPKAYVRTTYTLANYACNKAVAMRCRLQGDIPAALIYELACEHCYNDLPAEVRW